MTPLGVMSTGRFYKDDVAHDHSAHGYYITRIEGEGFDMHDTVAC